LVTDGSGGKFTVFFCLTICNCRVGGDHIAPRRYKYKCRAHFKALSRLGGTRDQVGQRGGLLGTLAGKTSLRRSPPPAWPAVGEWVAVAASPTGIVAVAHGSRARPGCGGAWGPVIASNSRWKIHSFCYNYFEYFKILN
jgi:hypothetical protein